MPVAAVGVLQQRGLAVLLEPSLYTTDTGMRVPSRAVAQSRSVT